MKEKKATEQKTITTDEVVENFKALRIMHKSVCFVSAFMTVCMIGLIIWGTFLADLRWIFIVFGIAMGICGAVLFLVVHRIYKKTCSAVLDFFRISEKMSETEIREKARELKIPIKKRTTA